MGDNRGNYRSDNRVIALILEHYGIYNYLGDNKVFILLGDNKDKFKGGDNIGNSRSE